MCRSLGVSLKRFHGWTPSDDDPVEWDETERDWMLALDDWEHELCPLCGLPRDVCEDPRAEFDLAAEPVICWGTAHRIQAARQWETDHPHDRNRGALKIRLTTSQ